MESSLPPTSDVALRAILDHWHSWAGSHPVRAAHLSMWANGGLEWSPEVADFFPSKFRDTLIPLLSPDGRCFSTDLVAVWLERERDRVVGGWKFVLAEDGGGQPKLRQWRLVRTRECVGRVSTNLPVGYGPRLTM